MSGSNSEKMGCGTVLFIAIVIIFFLGQLGSSLTMGGR